MSTALPPFRFRLALSLGCVLVSALPALAAGGPKLVPHLAFYDLKLDRVKGSRPVSDVVGRLSLEFTGDACSGYATRFRQVTRIVDADSGARTTDLKSESWEAGDGSSYRFRIVTEVNGREVQQSEGKADRAADGGISVDLRRPSPSRSDMAGEAVFPTAHVARMVETARSGGRLLETRLYDGSENGERLFDTTALIGARVPAEGRKVEESAGKVGLAEVPRWPVTVSYFEPGAGERTPVLVMSYDLFENGISAALRLDFGEFTLKGEMTRLDLLPPKGTCDR
jgi:hypothetical protein